MVLRMEKLAGVASLGKFLAMNTLKLIGMKEFEAVDYCGSGPFGVYSKWSSEVVYRKKHCFGPKSQNCSTTKQF